MVRQPYTEEFKVESISRLADGTTRSYKTTYLQAMDSHHRRMGLTVHFPQSGHSTPVITGSVRDPENGTSTEWNSRQSRAVVAQWPPLDQRFGCWQTDDGLARISFGFRDRADANDAADANLVISGQPDTNESDDSATEAAKTGPIHEDLGISNLAGVEAHGERWTWPPLKDQAVTENRPFVTSETWVATASRLMVQQRVEYPLLPNRTKSYSQDLVKLTMGEPNAKTFEPPEDFEVVTEEMHEVPCGQLSWPVP
jgi:hypothetical protein